MILKVVLKANDLTLILMSVLLFNSLILLSQELSDIGSENDLSGSYGYGIDQNRTAGVSNFTQEDVVKA